MKIEHHKLIATAGTVFLAVMGRDDVHYLPISKRQARELAADAAACGFEFRLKDDETLVIDVAT